MLDDANAIPVTVISMAAPTSEFERMVVSQDMLHNNNPVLNWNASNVVIRKDPAGNIKPDKELSQRRIDGVVASIMALAGTLDPTTPPSIYNTRGMIYGEHALNRHFDGLGY